MKDDFLKVRIKLTAMYTLIAAVMAGGYSLLLYQLLIADFRDSIQDKIYAIDPRIINSIISRTSDVLLNRILFIDIVILLVVICISFVWANRTLRPIRENMIRQKRFVADASHELRTPVAVMVSGLEVALRNKNLTMDDARETLNDTLAEMRELSKLSNHLLDISRYDADIHGTQSPIQITAVLNPVLQKITRLAEEKGVVLHTGQIDEASINGHQLELGRVFLNLLHNAIKYTPKGGNVTVEGQKRTRRYSVTIRDTGIGIDKEALDKIFDPFFQGDAAHNNGGAGLGLTLAKRIIESHRGSIDIQSEVNSGTTVTVFLPLV
ncbi:MAG: hypothetical protein RJB39_58 [Candidatus Parcubacteria bacterium]|jgi:signal transduction histidine kinase